MSPVDVMKNEAAKPADITLDNLKDHLLARMDALGATPGLEAHGALVACVGSAVATMEATLGAILVAVKLTETDPTISPRSPADKARFMGLALCTFMADHHKRLDKLGQDVTVAVLMAKLEDPEGDKPSHD